MKLYTIVVAGGSGQRFGSQTPKQFLELNGLPVIMHSINTFWNFDSSIGIVISLPADYFDFWQTLVSKYKFEVPHKIVAGGATRFQSVKNGLDSIEDEGLVAIHDAVRPLVSNETIARCFERAQQFGNAIPVIPMVDSIRELKDQSSFQVNRDAYVLVQTPQVFRVSLLKSAYKQEFSTLFTDDASVVEKMGIQIELTEGNRENIKITNQMDFIFAEAILKK